MQDESNVDVLAGVSETAVEDVAAHGMFEAPSAVTEKGMLVHARQPWLLTDILQFPSRDGPTPLPLLPFLLFRISQRRRPISHDHTFVQHVCALLLASSTSKDTSDHTRKRSPSRAQNVPGALLGETCSSGTNRNSILRRLHQPDRARVAEKVSQVVVPAKSGRTPWLLPTPGCDQEQIP
jgi:hypothetical protein